MLDISLRVPSWFAGKSNTIVTGHFKWFSFHRWGRIGKYHSWEVQLDYFGWTKLFEFRLGLDTTGHDHAGPEIELTILGFMFRFEMPDGRHWNWEEGRFYGEDEFEPGFSDWVPDVDDGDEEVNICRDTCTIEHGSVEPESN